MMASGGVVLRMLLGISIAKEVLKRARNSDIAVALLLGLAGRGRRHEYRCIET